MTTTRIHWADLPGSVHQGVTARLGTPILAAETVSAGFNSEIAARLTTSSGTVFVKGMQLSHPRVWTQRREAEINHYVAGLAPALLWHLEVGGWCLVAFEHVEARHADYKVVGDLELMVETLSRLGHTSCPRSSFAGPSSDGPPTWTTRRCCRGSPEVACCTPT
ncbi:hypothetical protein ABZW30_33570 [Kitasatospora sp. NPDC004669]|uniref:hypothetical protein n=1 Tax=Kitasatospora sp. NPDC004669 TaxID=3154555 RepID=UPI0033A677EA